MAVWVENDDFDLRVIMNSGQCFRMVEAPNGLFELVAYGRRLTLAQEGPRRVRLDTTLQEYESLWRAYFDLDTDYAAIAAAAPPNDAHLIRALAASRGLRILRQEPWETLCAFILSQRKHIKAIRACVEALCERFGEPVAGTARKAFPTPEALAAQNESTLCACGLGYRTPYILDAARRVSDGRLPLHALAALPDDALLAALCAVHGVGVKVAECMLLFAYARHAHVPVDVWIRRVIDLRYGGVSPFPSYGPYAGVYQQYLFLMERDSLGKGDEVL